MLNGGVGNPCSLLTFHLQIQESDYGMQEVGAMRTDIVGQPFI